ncbi:MAG TPA: DUF3618 domain-containing protein [Gammaproteobacteria bacterium]|nr:DUF3618 domain-containing protein [Gammaproteobacteria bacterium]
MSTSETDSGRNFDAEARRRAESRDDELADREPHAIEREIDATRADMRATLEALERRFSFDRLVDLTGGRVRERGGEFAGNLTDAATRNPLPLLLTSIGLGWMMLTNRRGNQDGNGAWDSRSRRRTDDLRERAGDIRDRAAHAADQARGAMDSTRDTLRQAAESSRETFEQTAESLRGGASRAAEVAREQAERVDRLLHEQPLMLGALGLAAGAIIGALLPTTEHEDRLLGDMRQKAVKDAAEKSRALYEAAREHGAAHSAPDTGETEGDASRARTSRPH